MITHSRYFSFAYDVRISRWAPSWSTLRSLLLLLQGTNLRYSSILGLFFNCMLTMLIVLLTVLAVLLCQNQQRRKKNILHVFWRKLKQMAMITNYQYKFHNIFTTTICCSDRRIAFLRWDRDLEFESFNFSKWMTQQFRRTNLSYTSRFNVARSIISNKD